MELRDIDNFYSSYDDKIQIDASPDNFRRPINHKTEADDDIAPWGDYAELQAYQSFKNKLLLSHKPPQKKPELPVASFEIVPTKPTEPTEKIKKKGHHRFKSRRLVTEGDKEPDGVLAEIGNTNKAISRVFPKLPGSKSGHRILVRNSIQVPNQEKPKQEKPDKPEKVIKVERKVQTSSPPPQKQEQVQETKPTEASQDTQDTAGDLGFSFPDNCVPIPRALVSNRIHTANSFFYLPTKQKPSRLRKRESISRHHSEQTRPLVTLEDSKKSLKESNLIVIRSFRDLQAITTGNENDKESLNRYAETLKNKLMERRLLNAPSSREKTTLFDTQISGTRTELNDPNKKLTPYGRTNLEKRVGKFFGEKVMKQKEAGEEGLKNNLKLKLEILRKINHQKNSVVAQQSAKEQENKGNGRSSKSSSLSVDVRTSITHPDSIETYSLQKFITKKPTLKTPNLLPLVQERNGYIKSIKVNTNFRENYT